MDPYLLHLAILCGIALILCQGFHISFGLGRLLNLAHVAAYALGAYVTALGSVEYDLSFVSCILLSAAVAALLALIVGRISLTLTEDYFAVGTLAFHSVVISVLINWREVTRGVLGIPGIPRPTVFGYSFSENEDFALLVLGGVLLSTVVTYWTTHSKLGRALQAQAESPQAAYALGINIPAIRNDAFIISSAFAGIAGAFIAYYLSYIDPLVFHLGEMIFVLSAIVVGRPGSFWGASLGTIFLVLLPEPLRFLSIPSHLLGPMRQLIHAAILFVAVFLNRKLLFPMLRRV